MNPTRFRTRRAGREDQGDRRTAPKMRPVCPQIDHLPATDGIDAETFAVHDIPGSDHRAVLTRLRLPA